jgi:hypothetical protein
VLVEFLFHVSDPDDTEWYEIYRSQIAGLLATWGPAWMTPVLRLAFLNL